MSHELETRDGKVSFAYTGEDPWHNLGTKLYGNPSPKEIMQAAGLDNWNVESRPWQRVLRTGELYFDGAGEKQIAKGGEVLKSEHAAYLRRGIDGHILDEDVSINWKPVQNETAFEFYDKWVEEGHMTMETAGSLFDGRIVFALARCGDEFEITPGDVIKPYMLFTNFFQYGKATDIRLVNERVVCKNTHAVAFSETVKNRFSMAHNAEFDADRARQGLGFVKNMNHEYQEKMQFLASVEYDQEMMEEFASKVFPLTGENIKGAKLSRNAVSLISLIDQQPGADFAPNSFFNLFNGVTFMASHLLGKTEESRLRDAWYGETEKASRKAFTIAMDMAKIAA